MKIKTIHLLIFFFSITNSFSQDPIFSQTIGGNFNLNSALAGNDSIGRLSLNHRDQVGGIGSYYLTSSVNFQQYIPKTNGFIGINYLKDNAMKIISTTTYSIFYSQNIQVKKLLIRPSIEIGFGNKMLDVTKLTFGDMIDPQKGFIHETGSIINNSNINYLDINTGAILYFQNLLVGASIHHVNSPNTSFYSAVSKLPIRSDFQLSYCFKINELRLSPFYYYSQQQGFKASVIGVNLKTKKHFNFSISNRINTALIYNIGYSTRKFSFNYSYDQTMRKIGYINNAHELAISFKFWKVKPRKKFAYIESVYN